MGMRAQGTFTHIIGIAAVYLLKLMEKIKEYEVEARRFKIILDEWLGEEWQFVLEQFGDCNLIKTSLAKCIHSLNGTLSKEANEKEGDGIKLNVDDSLRKGVTNYYSHIYVAKK